MKRHNRIKRKVSSMFCLSLVLMAMAGCNTSAEAVKKANENSPKVTAQVGASETYEGVAEPTLEKEYVQSEKDRAKYEPIMQDIEKNGTGTERELQSGI